jgi:DNA polymerase-4
LLHEARPLIATRGLTLVGIAVSNLDSDGYVQLELPFQADESPLDAALDAVRDRFGGSSVTRAVNLGQDLSPSVPILSD